MSSDAELDAKLTALLRVMVSRLPPNKKLPPAVVEQLLRSKYGNVYSDAYLASHADFIADTILKLSAESEKAVAQAKAPAASSSDDDDDSDDDDSDDDDDDEDDSSSVGDDEEDEEASADSDDDEDDDDEDDDDNSDDEDDSASESGDDDEPHRKKPRAEELDAIAKKEQQEGGEAAADSATTTTTETLAERCKAMAECLRKLTYRVRAPSDAETLEEYLQNFLIAEFEKHGMDPTKYTKSDVKRYRIKREVELLQQDGASLSLDRRNRAGRGFSNVEPTPVNGSTSATATPAVVSKQTSMFLDDE